MLGIDWALTSDASVGRFIGTIVLPLTAAVLYLLAVFSFGLSGDLAARQSMYPPRLFTLPVTTAALAGWPMVFGTVAMVVLAQAARLASWPSEVEPPFWLLLFAPVLLAWTQVRDLGVLSGSRAARRGRCRPAHLDRLDRDRRDRAQAARVGDGGRAGAATAPGLGRGRTRPFGGPAAATCRIGAGHSRRSGHSRDCWPRREQFASPLSAQTWCEWRQHGWSLPVLVAFVLPFAVGLLFLDPTAPAFVTISLAVVALTPPIMASFVASTVRRASPRGDDYGLAPFLATRPLTSAALIAAKLRVSIVSTVITWVLVIAVVPLALSLSNTWPVVIERARDLRDLIGLPRAVAVTVLAVLALVATTWKRLVTSLYIGLSGRPWLVRTHIGVTLVLLVAAIPFVQWIGSNTVDIVIRILDAVPVAAAILVALKMSAAAWIAIRLDRSRLIEPRALVTAAALWLAAVLALYAVFAWLADTSLIARYVLLLIAILAIPLTRLSAAPLALASNRHR